MFEIRRIYMYIYEYVCMYIQERSLLKILTLLHCILQTLWTGYNTEL